jgi:hypothetical protein
VSQKAILLSGVQLLVTDLALDLVADNGGLGIGSLGSFDGSAGGRTGGGGASLTHGGA